MTKIKVEAEGYDGDIVKITQLSENGTWDQVRLPRDSKEARVVARLVGPSPEAAQMLVSAIGLLDVVLDQLEGEGEFYCSLKTRDAWNVLVRLAHELGVELP
jgi:hypothetical protein